MNWAWHIEAFKELNSIGPLVVLFTSLVCGQAYMAISGRNSYSFSVMSSFVSPLKYMEVLFLVPVTMISFGNRVCRCN